MSIVPFFQGLIADDDFRRFVEMKNGEIDLSDPFKPTVARLNDI
jgi:hypothetical protein